jgi:hypothetical protein
MRRKLNSGRKNVPVKAARAVSRREPRDKEKNGNQEGKMCAFEKQ